MADALYTKYVNKLMNPGTLGSTSSDAVDLIDDNIKVVAVHNSAGGTSYTANLTTDEFLSDINSAARIALSGNLASKSLSGKQFVCGTFTFSAVAGGAGKQIDEFVVYKDTGTASTSSLIARFTTPTGLPVTPNGGDIPVTLTFLFSIG